MEFGKDTGLNIPYSWRKNAIESLMAKGRFISHLDDSQHLLIELLITLPAIQYYARAHTPTESPLAVPTNSILGHSGQC